MSEKSKESTKNLNGVKGWLALFIVAMGIGIIVNLLSLTEYSGAFADIKSIQSEMPEFVNAMIPALWFEVIQNIILIASAAAVITLIIMRKSVAKIGAIALISGAFIFVLADYIWVALIFSQNNLDLGLIESSGSDVVRSLITAAIWIPYFTASKRVKATLVK
ncbi:MAG TPA: DUF2569 family protein [Candidatus Saccharimonadales bacterium]|nr:DUF2569 family protein [Candidatus Saccharimonadales bacterium]